MSFRRHFLPFLAWMAGGFTAVAATLPAAQDSTSFGGRLTVTSGRAAALTVDSTHRAFLYFNLADLGSTNPSQVRYARLRVYFPRVVEAGLGVEVRMATGGWDEGADCPEPTLAGTSLATFPAAAILAKRFTSVDVTAAVQAWLADPLTNAGFALQALGTTSVTLCSKEGMGTGYMAELEVEMSVPLTAAGTNNLVLPGTTSGKFAGDGAGLTNLSASALAGTTAFGQSLLGHADGVALRDTLGIAEPRAGLANVSLRLNKRQFPLTVAITGSSMIESKRYVLRAQCNSTFGNAGLGLGTLTPVLTGGAVEVKNDFVVWPTGSYVSVPGGASVEYAESGVSAVFGDTVKIYYVQEPGAGTFAVQVSTDGGAYTTAAGYSAVIAEGDTKGKVITLTAPLGLQKVRVVSQSGTVKVISAALYRNNYEGVVFCDLAMNSVYLDSMTQANPAILAPIIADVRPDIYFYETKAGIASWATYLDLFRGQLAAGYAGSDWVLIGSSPFRPDVDPQNLQTANNRWLRGYAQANKLTYFDSYSIFGDGVAATANGMLLPDGVHLTQTGIDLSVSYMFSQLGLTSFSSNANYTKDGNRFGPIFQVHSTAPGKGAAVIVSSPRNTSRQLSFQREDGTSAGGIISTSENDASAPGETQIAVGNRPAIRMTSEARLAFGSNPPFPASGWFEFNVANPTSPGVIIRNNGTPARNDLLRFQQGDNTVLSRVDASGAFNGGVKVNGTLDFTATSAAPQNATVPAAWVDVKIGETVYKMPLYR